MMTEREIGLILAKLEALHEDITELKEVYKDTTGRISSLETFRSWASGAGALCMVVISSLLTLFK